MPDTPSPLLIFAGIGLALAAGAWLVLAVVARRRWRWSVAAAACCAVGAAGVIAVGLFRTPGSPGANAVRILPVPGVHAVTDLGKPVPIGVPASGDAAETMPEGFEWRAIAASRGERVANCHGWVFADGTYWLPSESIDVILRDNGYRRTGDPAVGDVVIYRDGTGRPHHSGLVKAIGEDGFVLIESKWGLLDVFWHTPRDQAFGDRYEYWHSDRRGHRLRLSGGATLRGPRGVAPARVGG